MIKSRRSANADLLQSLYDTVYRSSIQASLLETQGHDMSALMSWRNVLDIIDENRSVLNSTPHKTAVERSLFTSILDLDSQCRKHIAFLQDRVPYIQQSPPQQPLPPSSQFGGNQQQQPYLSRPDSNNSHNLYPHSSSTSSNRLPPPKGTPIRRPQPGASSESIPKLNSSQPLLSPPPLQPPQPPPADIQQSVSPPQSQNKDHPHIDPPRSTSPSKPFLIHTLRSGNGKQSSAKQHGAFLPPTSEPVASSAAAKAWSSGNSTHNLLSTSSEHSRPRTPRVSSDVLRNGSSNSIPKTSHSSAGHRSSPPPPPSSKPEGLLIDLGEQDRNKTAKAHDDGTDTPRRKHKSMLLEGDGTPSNPILLDTTPDKQEKQQSKKSKESKHSKEKDKSKEKKTKKKKGLTSSKLFPSLHTLRHATNSLTKNLASVGMSSPESNKAASQFSEGDDKSSQLSTPKPRTSSVTSPNESKTKTIEEPPTPVPIPQPSQAIPEKPKKPSELPQLAPAPPIYTPPPPPPTGVFEDNNAKVVDTKHTEDGEGFHSAESAAGSSVSFDSFESKKENQTESVSTNGLSVTASVVQPSDSTATSVPSLAPPPSVSPSVGAATAPSSSKLATAFTTPLQGMSNHSTPRSPSPQISTSVSDTKTKDDEAPTTAPQSAAAAPPASAPASVPVSSQVSHTPVESKKFKQPKHKYSKKQQASASLKAHPGSRTNNTSSSTTLEKTTYHVVRLHPTQKPSVNNIPQIKKVTSTTATSAAIASVEKSTHASSQPAAKAGVTKPQRATPTANGTGPKTKKPATAVSSNPPINGGTPAENEPATAPVMVGADGQVSSKTKDSEPEPEAGTWEAKVKTVLEELKGTIDENISQQILNDIVIKGDEVRWGDIAGLELAKSSLKETVVYPFLRPDLFSGLREPARGMLLFGPPGTGKTMLARAVATESHSTFFSISASSLTSKYLGESEKLVRTLFTLAKAFAPSIIFVDEIDSLLSTRNEGGEHEASRRIKNEFLVKWSDLQHAAAGREHEGDIQRVLVLAATNLPWAIDEAARRRFVRRQYIPLPERETRQKQLTNLLNHQKCEITDIEMEELLDLTHGFSGSDITALAKDAAMGPLRSLGEALLSTPREKVRAIGFQDFLVSLKYIKPSVSAEGLQAYEEWATKFGSSGA